MKLPVPGKKRSDKRRPELALLLAASLSLFSHPVFAQPTTGEILGGAPALYNVGEILINFAKFTNPQAADGCNLTRELIAQAIHKTLYDAMLPAVDVSNAKPRMVGVERVTLQPEITTVQDQMLNCTSFITLSVTGSHVAILPPVQERRSFTVSYWRNSTWASSAQTTHDRIVKEAAAKLAHDFAQDFILAQPPEHRPVGQKSDKDRQEELLGDLKRQVQDKLLQDPPQQNNLKDYLPNTEDGSGKKDAIPSAVPDFNDKPAMP